MAKQLDPGHRKAIGAPTGKENCPYHHHQRTSRKKDRRQRTRVLGPTGSKRTQADRNEGCTPSLSCASGTVQKRRGNRTSDIGGKEKIAQRKHTLATWREMGGIELTEPPQGSEKQAKRKLTLRSFLGRVTPGALRKGIHRRCRI